MTTQGEKRLFPSFGGQVYLIGVLLVLAAFFAGASDATDPDTFWRLRNGRDTIEHGRIVTEEIYSYTARGESAANWDWGFDLLLALWVGMFGLDGVVALKGLFLAGTVLLLLVAVLRAGLPPPASVLLTGLFLLSVHFRMFARPHLATMLFMGLYFLLLQEIRNNSGRWPIGVLIGAMALWSCLHKGSLFGLFLVGVYLTETQLKTAKTKQAVDRGRARALGVVLAGTVVAYGVTPFAWRRLAVMFGALGGPERIESFLTEYRWLAPGDNPWFYALLGLTVVAVALTGRRAQWSLVLIAAVLAAFGVRYARLAASVAAPALTMTLGAHLALAWRDRNLEKHFSIVHTRWLPLLLAMAVLVVAWGTNDGWQQKRLTPRLDMTAQPVAAVAFADRIGLSGPLFNDFSYGGYLLYAYKPHRPVFWDGRVDPYQTMVAEIRDLAPADVIAKYDFSWALISNKRLNEPNSALPIEPLFRDPRRWLPVYFDDATTIFVRIDGADAALAAKYGYRLIKPWLAGFEYVGSQAGNTTVQAVMKAETERALVECQGALPLVWAASLAKMRGHGRLAVELLQKAYERNPESYLVFAKLGEMNLRNGQVEIARDALRAAVRINDAGANAWLNLGLAELKLGRVKAAIRRFEKTLDIDPNHPQALFNLGLAREAVGDLETARQAYQRLAAGEFPNGIKRKAAEKLQALGS